MAHLHALTLALALIATTTAPAAALSPVYPLYKTAIPYLQCQVCHAAVNATYHQATAAAIAGNGDASISNMAGSGESLLDDIVQGACDPDAGEWGQWLTRLDVALLDGPPRALALVDRGRPGHCAKACRTAAKACARVFESWDDSIAEALARRPRPTLAALAREVCRDWASVCDRNNGGGDGGGGPTALPDGVAFAPEPFAPKNESEIAVDAGVRTFSSKATTAAIKDKEGLTEVFPGMWVADDVAKEKEGAYWDGMHRDLQKDLRKSDRKRRKKKKKRKKKAKRKRSKKKERQRGSWQHDEARAATDDDGGRHDALHTQ